MGLVKQYWDLLISEYGSVGLAVMAVCLLFFIQQLWYYLGVYNKIPKYRTNRSKALPGRTDAISVVVLVHDDYLFLEKTLPALLDQDYPDFEVIVVETGTTEDYSDELSKFSDVYSNLIRTRLDPDPRFPISNKMVYNVGIKAAHHRNVLFTTSDTVPASDKWLAYMSKGFLNGQVVLGYCGIAPGEGFAVKWMRCDRFASSVRWISSAIKGKPYRGVIQSLGFDKDLYFVHRGFDYLNMNIGEDDLFIQRIATRDNTSVVLHPQATVRESTWGGLQWWNQRRKFYGATWKYYPPGVKNSVRTELLGRVLFFASATFLISAAPLEIKIGAALLLLLRIIAGYYVYLKIRRRVGENGLGWSLVLYDILSPFTEAWFWISKKIKPAPGVYR